MKRLSNLLLLLGSILAALVASELLLALMGYQPALEDAPSSLREEYAAFCGVDSIDEAVAAGLLESPIGALRPDPAAGYVYDTPPNGFTDGKDFHDDHGGARRVLVLGDSFTEGASADPGRGFVALLDDHFRDRGIVFFNTGIGGYGQNNELGVLREHFDDVRPDLVLLAFYTGNDFMDNLSPVDRYSVFPGRWMSNYEVVDLGDRAQVRRRSRAEILRQYQRFVGCPRSRGLWRHSIRRAREWLLYGTRVGTRLRILSARLRTDPPAEPGSPPENYVTDVTRGYLSQIRDFLAQRDVPFAVLVIPDFLESRDVLTPSTTYRTALGLLGDLDIPYLDPFDRLDLSDYVERKPHVKNDHWNNGGHRKMFEMVRDCFGRDAGRDAFRFCTTPGL